MLSMDDLGWKVQFRLPVILHLPPLLIDCDDYYFCQTPCHCGEVRCMFRFEEEHPLHAFWPHGCTPWAESSEA